MAFSKIGFHCGLGGNHTGLGDYMRRLDEAGVPFCVKSVNNVGLAVEAARFARISGVPHQIVIRWSNPGVPPGPEVPDYRKSPDEAAEEHWQLILQSMEAAQEFTEFKDLIWVETINEPRTEPDAGDPNFENMHPADWLGWFAHHVGRLAIADGVRWAAFGMNAGTPEPQDWKRPGMVQYLEDCAAHPQSLAVALHEYTFDRQEEMAEFYPHLIGRFKYLYQACDELGVARPVTLITEGGWTYDNMPVLERALADIHWWDELVATYKSLQAIYLWTLEGRTDLPNKLQRLISPLTKYAIETRLEPAPEQPLLDVTEIPRPTDEPDTSEPPNKRPEPIETPDEKPVVEARGKPRVQYERTYVLLPPEVDRSWAEAAIRATWDRRNTVGGSPDDAGIGDLDHKRVIAINPEQWGEGEDGKGLRGFFEKYYPGVEYIPLEASSPAELHQLLAR